MLAAKATGVHDAEAVKWLQTLDDDMYQKLARLGLVPQRAGGGSTLGDMLDAFFQTTPVKASTKRTYEQTRVALEKHFGRSRALASITPLDGDQWRQAMRESGLSAATVAKRTKTAKQILRQAVKWKMLGESPFSELRAGTMNNRSRMAFITIEDTHKVLEACPDATWRLIVSLCRYGALRCPSELMPLTWGDIDFDKGVIHVKSSKTEGYVGKDQRAVPMFVELREALMAVYGEAEEGTEFVIARHRLASGNLRTQMQRIVKRSGLAPWPKLFQNLRSSRQTELSGVFPVQEVCQWLGNSPAIALNHYLQARPEHHATALAWRAPTTAEVATVGGVGKGERAVGGAVGGSVENGDVGQGAANGANVAA